MGHLAFQEWPDACIALGQEGACVQHPGSLCEGAEIDDNRNAALIMKPVTRLLEELLIACRPVQLC